MKKHLLRILSLVLLCSLLLTGAAQAEWKKSNGRWWYSYGDGKYAQNQWLKDGGNWYYFDANGWMVTGWKQIGSDWYYFYSNGVMATNTVIDGYTIGADGKMKENKTLKIDRSELTMKPGDSDELVITFVASGTLYYHIADTTVATCSFGDWYNSNKNIKLKVSAVGGGSTTIRITNSANSEELTVKVTVAEPWSKVKIVLPKVIRDRYEPKNRMSVTSYEFADNPSSSSTYLMKVSYTLVKYGNKKKNSWGQYVRFYDGSGKLLGTSLLYASTLSLGQTYKATLNVPMSTAKIVFAKSGK